MEIVGIDIGFGFTKATNGREFRIFKSVYGDATDLQFREQIFNHPSAEEHLHVELDGAAYFVGELAERQSVERFYTLDQKQFVNTFTKILALTALSRMVERQNPVKLVAGLPISHYRRYKDDLTKILAGQHKLSALDRGGKPKETVIRIAEVKVVPQPFGSMLNLMLNDTGEIADTRFMKEKIGIIDVGFRTTDYTVADKTRYSERGSNTADTGISRAFTAIATKLQERSGVNVEVYRLYKAVETGSIKIRGKDYDLKKIAEQALSQLGATVATDANRLWSDDWDIDSVIVTGGGGNVLLPYIRPHLHGEVLPVDTGMDARLNNVRGYFKYGKHLWARPR